MPSNKDKVSLGERGAAAVEMAFMVMLLVVLVTGIIDIGRALYTYIGVQDAAQEGALFGSYDPDSWADPNGEIVQRAVEATEYPTLSNSDVTVVCDSSTDPNQITVTVEHTVDLLTPIVGQWFGGSIDLSRSFTGTAFLDCP